ncbi:phage tail protein [Paraburkholderia megapolitana]|uniref:Phage Tail Collar Domain n=1 Tax=Paraburkholderia megapolitana TaxID=420953 RepID=A0A1I3DP05_9BURK|nr:tail fiber protein [Paraburkholderia megapolitana]QDQ79694.1 tail fiber protein [Paraburkholderia megapolitana]SFH88465.1 Phage Tail Collar Domain [Paraburkholderia megapolitana]
MKLPLLRPHSAHDEWPIGAVIPYAGLLANTDTDSATLNQIRTDLSQKGWLYCDGSLYSAQAYWQLYGVIGTSFGGNATDFNVPDLRGRFVRGVDGGAGNDPDAATRVANPAGGASGDHVGSYQADAFQGHEHFYTSTMESPETAEPPGSPVLMPQPDQVTTSVTTDGTHGTPRVSSETRALNLALNYLIRYR